MVKVLKYFVGIFALCGAMWAQTERGSIRGIIHDSSGAMVAGANVSAVNTGTGIVSQTTSTDAGTYNIPQLAPGRYQVSVEKDGFRKMIRENVVVEVAGTVGLDLELQIGAVSDSITVAAEAPLLKSETSEVSNTVSTAGFNDLPLSAGGGRSPETMLYLTPGFTGDTFDAHINGSQALSKEIQIDGMSTVIAEVQGDPRTITFPPDAVQEMSVMTSSYPAEFGNTGGGVERMIIRSGTNELRGRAWEILRNDKLDARGFFNENRAVHRENEYGFMTGGPVVLPKIYDGKNRTFFFTAFNWYKNRGGRRNEIASVPNDAFRNGDLSGLRNADGSLLQIYDPASEHLNEQGIPVRDPFPGNIIRADRISPVSRSILEYVPRATSNSVFNNFPAVGTTRVDNWNMTFKGDHNFNANQRMSLMYNRGNNTDNGPYAVLPHPVQNSRDGDNSQDTARITFDSVITPRIVNSFRAGFNRQHQLLVSPEMSTNWAEQLGISGTTNGFPVVNYGSFTPLAQNQDLIEPISNTFLFADSISWTKGKHNLKFGVDFRRLQHQGIYPSRPPQFNFNPLATASLDEEKKGSTGSAYASFLLGLVDSSNMYINDTVAGGRWSYLAGYVQDDFKVHPRLTLNLGLRWDMYTPMVEVADRYSIMDPSMPNPSAGNLPGAYVFAGDGPNRTGTRRLTTNSEIYKKAFGPRIGLAWKVRESFVIRTAYGISYSPGGGISGGNITTATTGYSGQAQFISPGDGSTPAFNWNNGFPQNFDRPPFIDPGLNVGGSASMWGDRANIPMQRQDWNFGTQYQLGQGLLLDISYVGAKSTHIGTGAFNMNQLDPKYLSLGSLLTTDINDAAVVAAGFRSPYPGFSGTLAQALRPFPQYTSVSLTNTANVGNATYHGLQTKVERQFGKDLFLLASYTWSKTLTDSNSSLGGTLSIPTRDQYNRRLDKALAIFDTPHRFVAAFTYGLPFGPGQRFFNVGGIAGKLLQGWQVNTFLTYSSGVPLQITVNNTLPLFNSTNTPNSVPGVNPVNDISNFDPNKNLYLNPNAFTVPATGQFGTSARVLPNARTFFNKNEDVALLKRTGITERVNVEFRFEVFNVFNRTVFAAPNIDFSSQNFGVVSSQKNLPRNGQVSLKVNF